MSHKFTQTIRNRSLIALLILAPIAFFSCKKDESTSVTPISDKLPSISTSYVGTNVSTALGSDLMFMSGFEDVNSISTRANSTSVFCNIEEPSTSSITRSQTVANGGHYSMKILLNKSDPLVNGGKRAEVSFKQDPSVQVERWIGISMFLPSTYITDPEPESVLQYHDIPDLSDGGVWRSPPFALETKNGRWLLIRRWSAARLTSNLTSSEQDYDLGPYDKNVWTNWVFHIRFAWDSTGLIQIWKDGKSVLTVNGPNAYNDKTGNYLKVGLYKWMWNPEYLDGKSTTSQRIFYVDGLRIGNEKSTYSDVAPYLY